MIIIRNYFYLENLIFGRYGLGNWPRRDGQASIKNIFWKKLD